MRKSVLTYEEAMELVSDYSGRDDCRVVEAAASCHEFPCPCELDSWSGETNAIYVYDDATNEEIFAVAYCF